MATVSVEGDEIVVTLSHLERVEAVHGDLRLARSSLRSVTPSDDVAHLVHGFKAMGTNLPGGTDIGTFLSSDSKTFAVVHRNQRSGVVLTFEGERYDQVILSHEDPSSVVGQLR